MCSHGVWEGSWYLPWHADLSKVDIIDGIIIQIHLAPLIMLGGSWVFMPRRVLHRLQGGFALQRQRNILIVEDDDDLRLLLADLLAEAGFPVRTARDGQEALARLRQEHSGVVLLDWMLPGLNGRQVLALVEADPTLRADVKVVVMSADWRLEQERQVLESDVVAARLPKPFDPETLARHLTQTHS
jgi:CheY-like chemotaxis protein